MKKIVAQILLLFTAVTMLLGFTECSRRPSRQETLDAVNQIEKSPDFAIIDSLRYVSSSEEIYFPDLVKEKMKEDGIHTEYMVGGFMLEETGEVSFCYHDYFNSGEEKLAHSKEYKNYHFAVGSISLKDFSISIHYFEYDHINIAFSGMKEKHHIVGFEHHRYLTIDRATGEVKEWYNEKDAQDFAGEHIPSYKNPKIYTENGVEYLVNDRYIKRVGASRDDEIHPPTISSVMEKSEEMRKINEILDNRTSGANSYFFTNGEDLFVGFYAELGLLGRYSDLTFPIIFRCDSSLDAFEYIGCSYSDERYFHEELLVKRITNTE